MGRGGQSVKNPGLNCPIIVSIITAGTCNIMISLFNTLLSQMSVQVSGETGWEGEGKGRECTASVQVTDQTGPL